MYIDFVCTNIRPCVHWASGSLAGALCKVCKVEAEETYLVAILKR